MDQLPAGYGGYDPMGGEAAAYGQEPDSPVHDETFKHTVKTLWRRSRDHADDTVAPTLARIWSYYDGKVDAEPAFFIGYDEQGNPVHHGSKVVVRECWDKVQAVLPDLARIFLGSQEIVQYVPKKPEDEAHSAQATDYANYVLWSLNDGEQLLLDTLILWLVKFCALKVYWQQEEEESRHTFSGLSEQAMSDLAADAQAEGSEIVELHAQPRMISVPVTVPDGMGGVRGMAQPMTVYDGHLVRLKKGGKICIELVPHEELVIDPDATHEDCALFVGCDTRRTVTDLVEMGVPYDVVVEHIGAKMPYGRQSELELARRGRLNHSTYLDTGDKSLDYVRTIEAKVMADGDGDGRAERYRVLLLGDEPELVAAVEAEDVYYIIASPFRRPHEPIGTGLAEATMDLQDQLTALLRGIINSSNRANTPREVVDANDFDAYQDLKSPLQGPIRARAPQSIGIHAIPYVGDKLYPIIEYVEARSASRTGVSPAGQGLDPDVLKGQTVEAAKTVVTAPQSRIEFLAREFAAGVMRPLFRAILKLSVKYQDKKAVFRLRNQWVEADPRSWNAEMDCDIKVGLGTGTRSEKFVALNLLKATQEALLMQGSPLVTVMEYRETLVALCEMLGFKDASRFIKEVSEEDLQAHAQQQQQAAQQQLQMGVAAKQAEEQAKAQGQTMVEQAKAQNAGMLENIKSQHEQQIKAAETAAQQQLAAIDGQIKTQIEQMKIEGEKEIAQMKIALEQEKMLLDHQLKIRELEKETALEKEKMKNQSPGGNADVRRPK